MRRLWARRFRGESEGRYLSVLDLGASSVKALVIQREGNQVTILGRGRAPAQNVGHPVSGIAASGTVTDMDALASDCEQALCEAEDATEATCGRKIVPDEVLVAVPAAWLRGATGSGGSRRVALETGVVIQECYESVVRAGRRAMRNLGRATGPGTWALVDAALITFSIDGRRVTDPVGFRGYLLEATVVVAAAPRGLLDSLREVADRLQLEPPYMVTEPLALAAASPGDGLIIEVGACTTGLCLSRYGAPLALGSVLGGGAELTQVLADVFKLSPSRAEVLKRAYSAGQLSLDATLAVREALAPHLEAWFSAVIQHLRSWDSVSLTWSPDIYLCGGARTLPDVREWVSAARWLDLLPFPHTPNVQMWDGSTLSRVLDRTEPRWQADGIITLSLAAWVARDRGITAPNGMLRTSLGLD